MNHNIHLNKAQGVTNSNSHFSPERGCVVLTSRSRCAKPKDFLACSVLRLVLCTQLCSKMRIAA
jgi:hypothetical protein